MTVLWLALLCGRCVSGISRTAQRLLRLVESSNKPVGISLGLPTGRLSEQNRAALVRAIESDETGVWLEDDDAD